MSTGHKSTTEKGGFHPIQNQVLSCGFARLFALIPLPVLIWLPQKCVQGFFWVFLNNKPLRVGAILFLSFLGHASYYSIKCSGEPDRDRTCNRRTGPGCNPGAFPKFRHGGAPKPSAGAGMECMCLPAPAWSGPLDTAPILFSFQCPLSGSGNHFEQISGNGLGSAYTSVRDSVSLRSMSSDNDEIPLLSRSRQYAIDPSHRLTRHLHSLHYLVTCNKIFVLKNLMPVNEKQDPFLRISYCGRAK